MRVIVVVAALLASQGMLIVPADAWRFPRGPASGTGANLREDLVTSDNVASLTRIWARGKTGGYRGGLTASDGRVFYGTGTGYRSNGPGQIVARRSTTGRLLWATTLSGKTYSTPVIAGGRVFAMATQAGPDRDQGRLYALSAATGHVLWSYGVDGGGSAVPMSPVIHAGTVFMEWADSNSTLTALDAASGEVVWQRRHQRLGYPLAFARGHLLAGGLVYGVRAGHLRGSLPGPENTLQSIVTPRAIYAVAQQETPDGQPYLRVRAYPVRCLSAGLDCRAIWKTTAPGVMLDRFAVTAHRVLIPVYVSDRASGSGALVALGSGRGRHIWTWSAPPQVQVRGVSVGGDVAYLTVSSGSGYDNPRFYAFALAGCGLTACQPLGQWNTGQQGISTETAPVIEDGVVYIWNDWEDGVWAYAPS